MMGTVTFDTLEAARRLKEAGFTDTQAETLVRVLWDSRAQLLTREHFDTKMSFDNRLDMFELRLTIKIGVMMTVFAGIIFAVLRLPV